MAGLPVVAATVEGVPELVEDGVTSFLAPPKDPKVLAGVLQKLIDDPELRRRMGEADREKALREVIRATPEDARWGPVRRRDGHGASPPELRISGFVVILKRGFALLMGVQDGEEKVHILARGRYVGRIP